MSKTLFAMLLIAGIVAAAHWKEIRAGGWRDLLFARA